MINLNIYYFFWFLHIITESLPISSSGHLKLASKLFKIKLSNTLQDLMHIPTVVILFMVLFNHRHEFVLDFNLIILIIIADAITSLFYLILGKRKETAWSL